MRVNRYIKTLALVAAAGLSLALWGARRHHHRQAAETRPVSVQVQRTPTNAVAVSSTSTAALPRVDRNGEYTDKDGICWYIVAFGTLPKNFITKAEARRLGWQGGPLEPYAPGKSIGGDRFGNYERTLPDGSYRECDVDTRGRPRGAKRIVFSSDRRVYYSDDHYHTFKRLH